MRARLWVWAGAVAAVRVGALWYLVYREWTHQQSIATLPLVLALYPEGLLLGTPAWTPPLALAFSAVLIAGSLLWVYVLAFAGRRLRRSSIRRNAVER